MSVSRRGFLKSGTMLALSVSVTAGLANSVLGKKTRTPVSDGFGFRQSDFEPFVNSQFRVHVGPAKSVEMRLVKITDLSRAASKKEREAFSLLFESHGAAARIPQDTYLFEHRQLGKIRLFAVPATGKKKLVRYEVIVNRLR